VCRSIAFAVLILEASIAGTILSGCMNSRVFIREGNANSVEIGYSGSNVADTLPRARQHCAQFERVPQLVDADGEVATYDCRRP
jgi:hypothetical protein